MKTICGSDCCDHCPMLGKCCSGCLETDGHPCGGTCVAAECICSKGMEGFAALKSSVMKEINGLGIPGLSVSDLNLLNGSYVNLEYPLPNGQTVKLLEDQKVYLGNQVERPGSARCYGVVADEQYLLVCEYGCGGAEPEIVLYRRREKDGTA